MFAFMWCRRNIVSPIHFLQGSSINNQIVVESLAGVLLGLKKFLFAVRTMPNRLVSAHRPLLFKHAFMAASMDLMDFRQLSVFSASGIIDEIVAAGECIGTQGNMEEYHAAENQNDLDCGATKEVQRDSTLVVTELVGVELPAGTAVGVFHQPTLASTSVARAGTLEVGEEPIRVRQFVGEFALLDSNASVQGWIRVHDVENGKQFFEITASEATCFRVFVRNCLGVSTRVFLDIVQPELSLITHPIRPDRNTYFEDRADPANICVFASSSLEACNALRRNVAGAIPCFVRPDLQGTVSTFAVEADQGSETHAKDALDPLLGDVDGKGETSLHLGAFRDEFCAHIMKASNANHRAALHARRGRSNDTHQPENHAPTQAVHSTAQLELNKTLTSVFLTRFGIETSALRGLLDFKGSGGKVLGSDGIPSWCSVLCADSVPVSTMIEDVRTLYSRPMVHSTGGVGFVFHMHVVPSLLREKVNGSGDDAPVIKLVAPLGPRQACDIVSFQVVASFNSGGDADSHGQQPQLVVSGTGGHVFLSHALPTASKWIRVVAAFQPHSRDLSREEFQRVLYHCTVTTSAMTKSEAQRRCGKKKTDACFVLDLCSASSLDICLQKPCLIGPASCL